MQKRINISLIKNLCQNIKRQFSEESDLFTIKLPSYETHRLNADELPKECKVTRFELLQTYEIMTRIRRMEIACDNLYKQRQIRGFCHLYDGQEAVIVGIENSLTKLDYMITAYRCHGHAILRGDTPYTVIAEMMGKHTGGSKGKGGSMHFYSGKDNFYGGHGIVGAQLPLGTGLAFALKYRKRPHVCVTMYGDGAANQGQLYEAANMAYMWKLPVIYVCENNEYAMGTCTTRASMNTNFYQRGDQIPGFKLDGLNYFHVKEAVKWAKNYALKNGPVFIEMKTYRYHGHSMSDPGTTYRTREEVQEVRKRKDCINLIKSTLIDNKLGTEEELKEIENKVKQEVDEAVNQAKLDPIPDPKELMNDTYINNQNYYIRNIEYINSQFPEGKPY